MEENEADVIVVGAGLTGLVAATELADAGKRVIVLDQEAEQSPGGQAFWSFGGLFFVNSPEQRRFGIHDSRDLAMQDWLGSAGFDREEDHWPRQWAERYVDFAAGEKRTWLKAHGVTFFPVIGWAERGGYLATEHGNSVPRFHITWGTGPGLVEPFVRRLRDAERKGLILLRCRHRANELTKSGGAVDGVAGDILEPSDVECGAPTSREVIGEFALKAQAVIVTSGGIGGNHELVRRNWPESLGTPPGFMLSGVPDYVDGRMLEATETAGGNVINSDRMWHYTEGVKNYAPIWSRHGIRIIPGPSSLWFDAAGKRLPAPLFPGFDTLGTLKHLRAAGHDYSWFILNQRIIGKEFGLSGSEQNPDLTNKSIRQVINRMRTKSTSPVAAFQQKGEDFVTAKHLSELVRGMNALTGDTLIDEAALRYEIEARDREIEHKFCKDAQVVAIRSTRAFLGDKLVRVAKPHKILDPAAGPLIAVRLWIITCKTLGGVQTDLSSRVRRQAANRLRMSMRLGKSRALAAAAFTATARLKGRFSAAACSRAGRLGAPQPRPSADGDDDRTARRGRADRRCLRGQHRLFYRRPARARRAKGTCRTA